MSNESKKSPTPQEREMLKGHLEPLLLAVVAKGPAHGYAIIEALKAASSGEFDLPEGSVYPALHRLEEAGLLVSRWITGEGRKRRVYELSDRGMRALGESRKRWSSFSRAVTAVLGSTALLEGTA